MQFQKEMQKKKKKRKKKKSCGSRSAKYGRLCHFMLLFTKDGQEMYTDTAIVLPVQTSSIW